MENALFHDSQDLGLGKSENSRRPGSIRQTFMIRRIAWQLSICPAVDSIPGKVSGACVFKDTRMPVSLVFENLEAGATIDDIMEWPHLRREQVLAVLEFAARSLDGSPIRQTPGRQRCMQVIVRSPRCVMHSRPMLLSKRLNADGTSWKTALCLMWPRPKGSRFL